MWRSGSISETREQGQDTHRPDSRLSQGRPQGKARAAPGEPRWQSRSASSRRGSRRPAIERRWAPDYDVGTAAHRRAHMLVPFGTRVVDSTGKGVGTVSRLVLHHASREVAGVVVHQGILDRREIVVPASKVTAFGDEVRLSLRASELAGLDLFRSPTLQPMPDHWDMPMGFDERDFFLVGGDGWTESVLPFERTSPAVSGTRAYVREDDSAGEPVEPDIAAGMDVYDRDERKVGDVEAVEIDEATRRVTRIVVRRGFLFTSETTVPASLIESVTDHITLRVGTDAIKRLEKA